MYGVEGVQRPTGNGERSSDERPYARAQLDYGGAGAMDHSGAMNCSSAAEEAAYTPLPCFLKVPFMSPGETTRSVGALILFTATTASTGGKPLP